MKYNKDLHCAIVSNMKDGFKARFKKELILDDKEIFKIWDEWCLCESDTEDKEQPIYEALEEAQSIRLLVVNDITMEMAADCVSLLREKQKQGQSFLAEELFDHFVTVFRLKEETISTFAKLCGFSEASVVLPRFFRGEEEKY